MFLVRFPRRWSTHCSLFAATALAAGLLLLCLHLPAVAQSPQPSSGDEGQTLFTYQDGLASNGVTALLRDDRSLWVGTTAGLNRYALEGRDAGLAWQTLTSADGLAADAVSDLWADDDGGLWVAHPDGEISYSDSGGWTTFDSYTETLEQTYKQIVASNAAGSLWAIEEGGRVWTLAEGTVGYYVGAVWRPYGEDAGIPRGNLVAVWTGEDGAWVASENGQIGYFDGANWTTFRNAFDAVQSQYETVVASGATNGPLWIVDQEDAVWVRNAFNQRNPRPDVRRFVEGRWTNFGSGNGMASGFVAELRLDAFGRVWARHLADENGRGGGLSLYIDPGDETVDGPGWTAITPALTGNVTDFWPEGTDGVWVASFYQPEAGGVPVGGLSYVALDTWQRYPLTTLGGIDVGDTWLDENGELWLGLSGDGRRNLGGLWYYRPARGVKPAVWTQVQGLLGDDVRDLWGDGQGNLWAVTADGVNRITLKNRRVFSFTLASAPDQIAGNGDGDVWAVALGKGGSVWQWKGSAWTDHALSEGLSEGDYADLLVSTQGRVYLATDRGLDIWDGDEWDTFAALPGRHVKQVWQDAAGDLWLTSEITPGRPFNLSLNRGRKWETVLNETGSRGMGSEPLAFLRDSRGRAWLGTPLGLFVYEPDGDAQWRGLGPAEGLPAGAVPAIYEDAGGTVWLAVEDEVYRTDGWDWRRFEPQVGAVRRITAGPEGSLLFAGEAGVALYRPSSPNLRLDGAVNLITGEVEDGREPVVLTIGRNAMRVDLVAVAPTLTADQFSYRYRLEGYDPSTGLRAEGAGRGDGWRVLPARSLGGKQASLPYAGLPAGTYTFTAAIRTDALDYSPEVGFQVYVLSRPPELVLDQATVGGRPAEQPGALKAYIDQPVQIRLSSGDDQFQPLTYRYRIEGSGRGDGWTETTQSSISFTLSTAGTYTFVAEVQDDEGQLSLPVGSQIVVRERETAKRSSTLPLGTIATGLGAIAALFIGAAVFIIFRRRRRESW